MYAKMEPPVGDCLQPIKQSGVAYKHLIRGFDCREAGVAANSFLALVSALLMVAEASDEANPGKAAGISS
eukprot:jgi/Chrzof1/4028/Cz13g17220.t1